MSRKFAAIVVSIATGAFAFEASAVPRPIPQRSAIQEECIKENPQDHKGYLVCIQRKKAEQKSSAVKNDVVRQPETPAPAAAQ